MNARERASLVRSLASLLRSGLSVREALIEWPDGVDSRTGPLLARTARRASLGAPFHDCLEPLSGEMGDDAAMIGATLSFHSDAGGDIARCLDRLAIGLDDRHASLAKGRIAGAAAKLSGRLVAGLPLVFVPLLPAAHAPLFDGVGISLVVAGVGLAVAGMVWMGRLIPTVPAHDDAVALIADRVSILLDAGIPLPAALRSVASDAPGELRSAAARTRRLFDLGLSWTAALQHSGAPALAELGAAIDRGVRNGLPLARTLDRFAAERRADIARSFEEAARKASVWVVVPLVLCVLPSFALLALAPFLRGLAFG